MHAFYRVWSRKEAVIKADGRGVSIGLDRFDVSAGDPPALLHARWDGAAPDEAARWSLRSLDAGPGYAAALAVRRPDATVVIRTGAVPSRPEPSRHPRLNDPSRPPHAAPLPSQAATAAPSG